MRRLQLLIVVLLAAGRSDLRAQGTCFKGPIRPGCSGFVLLEGSATTALGGADRRATFDIAHLDSTMGTYFVRYRDLPGYYSGSLGYVRVIDPRTAIGAVGELGLTTSSEAGDTQRLALTGRWRRQLPNWTLDAGAGPLLTQVFDAPSRTCCAGQTMAYGGTAETALLYRGQIGLTAGADLIHGAGRTSGGLHAGVRVGSYSSVVAAAIGAGLLGVIAWGLRNELD